MTLSVQVDGSSEDQPAAFRRPGELPAADLNPERRPLCVQSGRCVRRFKVRSSPDRMPRHRRGARSAEASMASAGGSPRPTPPSCFAPQARRQSEVSRVAAPLASHPQLIRAAGSARRPTWSAEAGTGAAQAAPVHLPPPPVLGVPFPSTLTLGRWSVRRSLARAASSRRRCA